MQRCDDFELMMERRLHGDLTPDELATLDAHLASCTACRTFKARCGQLEDVMTMQSRHALARVDWARLQTGFERQRSAKERWWLTMLPGVLMLPPIWAVNGRIFEAAIALIAVGLMSWQRTREWLEDARAAERTRDSLLTFYGTQLTRSIRRARLAQWLMPLIAGVLLVTAGRRAVATWETAPLRSVALAFILATLCGVGLWSRLITEPRLRRERQALH